MADVSLYHHMKRAHRIVMPHTQGVDIGGGGPEKYVVPFLHIMKLVVFPVDVCPAREKTQGDLENTSCIVPGRQMW